MRKGMPILLILVVAAIVWSWTRPDGPDEGEQGIPKDLKVTGDVDVFPTPLSFAQFGAKLEEAWLGTTYDDKVMGAWRTTQKPLYLVATLVSSKWDQDIIAVGPTPALAMQKMFDQFPAEYTELFKSGDMIAVVHAASHVKKARTAVLDRSVQLGDGEGLAVGDRVFTPDRLIRAGVLSRSGEVRQEQLAKLFKDGDKRRSALLAAQPCTWATLKFRQLWVDSSGFHLRSQWPLLTKDRLDQHVYRLGLWLTPHLDEIMTSVVRPQFEKAETTVSTLYEFDRLRTILDCPAVPASERDVLRGIVASRQIGTDGWVHATAGRPVDLQLQAATLGLLSDDKLEICDDLIEGRSVAGFSGQMTEETRFEYAVFRQRKDWLDDWLAANLTLLNLRDQQARRFLPRLLKTRHPALSDWLRDNRKQLVVESEIELDSSENLLNTCAALRALPSRTFDEEAVLCRFTRLLVDRLVRPGPHAKNPDWTGGLRIGRLDGVVSFTLSMRMLTHLDWMQSLLKVRGEWARVTGVVGDTGMALMVHRQDKGMFVAGLFSPPAHYRIHGLIHDIHRPALTAPAEMAVYVAPGVAQAGARVPNLPWHPFGGVQVVAVGPRLTTRVLTAAGEVRIGRDLDAVSGVILIDPDKPLEALRVGYLQPTANGPRWVLY